MSIQPIDRDKVLSIVKMRGPLIPTELKRALGQGDTMLLGAMLSELSGKGLVKISKTKLGGSPFYYDPQQPAKLERIAEHLGEKDKRTWQLLKEKRVLRDERQEALTRVSLRNIKDFAKELRINAPDGELLYWKYYLVTDEEAERLIKEELGLKPKEAPPQRAPTTSKPAATAPITQKQGVLASPKPSTVTPKLATTPTKATRPAQPKHHTPKETQKPLLKEIDDPFYTKVRAYFDERKIRIKEQRLIRKKSEIDFVIRLPTPVGPVEYYCKAKSKKRSNDGDLASAKLQGNAQNLPVLYLTTGEITKKAKEMLTREFKGLVVKEL